MLGAKVWQSWWDSAVGDYTAEAADASLEELFAEGGYLADFRSDPKQGDGILGGPMLSYQTDDGLWTMSLAWMGFGSFSQDTDLAVNGVDIPIEYNLDLDRSEIDFSISRKVSERFKVFFGFKQQNMEYDYDVTIEGEKFPVYKSEATMTMSSVGAGYVHPLSDNIGIGLQAGLLIVDGTIGYEELLWPGEYYGGYADFDTTVGFNGELSLAYMIAQKIMLQGGYRYQSMRLKAEFRDGSKLDDTDTVHGFFLSFLYMFDL